MPPAGPGALLLMIRPERLAVIEGAAPDGLNLFEGRVRDLVYQGDTALAAVALADGSEVAVRSGTRSGSAFDRLAVGAAVVLGLHPDDTVLIPDEG